VTEEIQKIVESIKKSVPVSAIYLFGSFAKGTQTENSDYDIYVVIPDNTIRALNATDEIMYAIPKLSRPIDMLVGTQSKFNKYKNVYSIENEVSKTGVKLYG